MEPLARIDWNLVVLLDALLSRRNVSAAARRLGTTQPAASRGLARLRRHFDDELLVKEAGGYVLTPFAQRLAPLAEEAVMTTRRMLLAGATFDPATTTRVFEVATTEYGQLLIGGEVARRLEQAAPRATLAFRRPAAQGESLVQRLATLDGWWGPRDALTDGTPSSGCHTDRWVCVVDARNERVGDVLEVAEVDQHSWVLPTSPHERQVPWLKRLLAYGIELEVGLMTESFVSVPFLVAGTRRVGVAQEGMVRLAQRVVDLRIIPCPWPMPPLTLTLWWHENRRDDPAHAWFRTLVAGSMEKVAPVR